MISIIIPVFNLEGCISACLESLMAQTYPHMDLIAVDDGSTDRSPEILDYYAEKDSRVRVIHQENSGVTAARFRGIRAAAGEWIGFVDGDDWVDADMFERLLNNAGIAGAEISHCGYQMAFHDRVDYYYNTGVMRTQTGREALGDLLSGSYEPGLWNKLYRRELLEGMLTAGVMDTSVRINEDLLMNFYLFRSAGRTVFEDFCPYHYRVRPGSAAKSAVSLHRLSDPVKVRRILTEETRGDSELNALCRQELARAYIRTASEKPTELSPEIRSYIKSVRQELQHFAGRAEMLAGFPLMLKNQVLAAAVFPGAYRFVHHIYGEITGVNHKYDFKRTQ